jgi:hypothetical protein
MRILRKPTNFSLALGMIIVFWYISQFPGRLGFDNSEIIRMLQSGRSTDWWSAEFFWYMKILSGNGRVIFVLSAVQTVLLTIYLMRFVRLFIAGRKTQDFVILATAVSPIFGNMAVNVSHDTFIVIGALSIVTDNVRFFRKVHESTLESRLSYLITFVGLLSLTFSTLGKIILISQIVFLIITRQKITRYLVTVPLVGLFSITSFLHVEHFDKTQFNQLLVWDLKCIAQHEMAEISENQWVSLESFAPREEWKIPVSCKLGDAQVAVMPNLNYENLPRLAKTYFEIVKQNPAIALQAHFQRASPALPPPFFYGPENQVIRDPNIPVGLGSNNALQQGTELLHPSVDEPSVNVKVPLFYPFEAVAQTLIFVVNQASWFWGWGGLWLYPIALHYILKGKLRRIVPELFPIIVLHLSLVVIGPGPFGRYVLTTILIGYMFLSAQLYEFVTSRRKE